MLVVPSPAAFRYKGFVLEGCSYTKKGGGSEVVRGSDYEKNDVQLPEMQFG